MIKIELGIRPVYDFEVVAISAALNIPVAFLLGVSEDSSQPLPESQ
ncbi:transcriptional regulator [Deinococcus sp. Arct2-2]|nr:transcriptional regulator [Deinococcus sp. Arct2-2]